ncbi:MAG TPA: ChaN family lipoprotein [Anaeromyxobacteraceae bacterium]|nr:ChaN family lipoprotein [Anaeromyxobacteraceae bacterium]
MRRLVLAVACAAAALAASVAACAGSQASRSPAGESWRSPLERSHPLAGRVYDVRAGRFASWAELEAAVAAPRFVLLGETHDNADHHLLQARLVRAVAGSGRRMAVAFEMLDAGEQKAVDRALARAPGDPDALAAETRWAKSGWPDFALYRPIFTAALDAGFPIAAVNLTRDQAREVVRRGPDVLEAPVRELLEKAGPLPGPVLEDLRKEMAASHCGALPESMMEPMVVMQRARDVKMAQRTAAAADAAGGGAVLVAGAGHVRRDRGVPAYLALEAPSAPILAVAFLEVSADETEPGAYASDMGVPALPFDWVVFTPRAERDDPCEGLRARVEKGRDGGRPMGGWLDGGAPDAGRSGTKSDKEADL